jgi:hypothetical protein
MVFNNLPYILMALLGGALIYFSSSPGMLLAYFGYALFSGVWVAYFICSYCPMCGTRSCPHGFGIIAGSVFGKKNSREFAKRLMTYIWIILPLWFVPLIFAGISMIREFTVLIAVLTGIFILEAFILITPFAVKYGGCGGCPNKKNCPFMKKR